MPGGISNVILKDAKKLDLSYVPKNILCRGEELKRLKIFVSTGKVLISGGIGTGKTMLARHIGGDAYVNCYMNKTEHRVLEEIIKQLKPRFNPAGLPNQKLWNEIESGKRIILDEMDGMNVDELRHFAYSISRQYEVGKKIEYIAITRNHFILEQMMNDEAIWSTFAGKAVVELKPYTREQMREILAFRAQESLDAKAYDDDIIALITDSALISPGHMRTGIDLMRNAALMAESRGDTTITPDDVREANREEWVGDLENMEKEEMLVFLAVAAACRTNAYVSMNEIVDMLRVKEEEYHIKVDETRFKKTFQALLQEDFVYQGADGFTILHYPVAALIEEIEKRMSCH